MSALCHADGPLVAIERVFDAFGRYLLNIVAAFQVRLISLCVSRPSFARPPQAGSQRAGDRLGDLILNRQNVAHVPVIAAGPDMAAIGSSD
jgi:hypothetical protein